MRTRVRKAFTLVEILIVVVILGILAAIVVPQFTNATQDAQGGNIQAQLDTLNNQIELFRARNNGTLPACTSLGAGSVAWADMIAGGYIKAPPRNPACPSTGDSSAVGAPATADVGWHWNATTSSLEAAYFDESTTGATALRVTPGVP